MSFADAMIQGAKLPKEPSYEEHWHIHETKDEYTCVHITGASDWEAITMSLAWTEIKIREASPGKKLTLTRVRQD